MTLKSSLFLKAASFAVGGAGRSLASPVKRSGGEASEASELIY